MKRFGIECPARGSAGRVGAEDPLRGMDLDQLDAETHRDGIVTPAFRSGVTIRHSALSDL